MSKICGAKTRSGKPCQYKAGAGTDHVGTGKCRLHGGASKGAPKGNKNAQKHGIYSRIIDSHELDEAKDMQGSIETELAIARIQLSRLLKKQQDYDDEPQIDRIEEKTIQVEDKQKSLVEMLVNSAKKCGEEYDPDGDEDFFYEQQEKQPFERKRIFQRRNFIEEFTRLVALISRLEHQLIGKEQQLLNQKKTKAEIKIIEATVNKPDDADNKLTDTELDSAIQSIIGGFTV